MSPTTQTKQEFQLAGEGLTVLLAIIGLFVAMCMAVGVVLRRDRDLPKTIEANNADNEPRDALTATLSRDDILILISLYLPISDLAAIEMSSVQLKRVLRRDLLWCALWRQRFQSMLNSAAAQRILELRGVAPSPSWRPLQCSWRDFYCMFEFSWVDWLAAGSNTRECCLVGVRGALFDLTSFADQHPGGDETLLWAAGGDATDIFEDIGHSSEARSLLVAREVCRPRVGTDRRGAVKFRANSAMLGRLRRDAILANSSAANEYREGVADRDFHEMHSLSLRPMTALRAGGRPCATAHSGQCRVCLDPFSQQWSAWWSCCGWGAAVDPQRYRRRVRYSLRAISSCSSNLTATVSKTAHLIDDIQRSLSY